MAPVGAQYRQGDVLLVAEPALPGDAAPVAFAAEPLALVPGEAGPGSHTLAPSAVLRAYSRKGGDGSVVWIELAGTVTLAHPEHAPVALEPGIWRVIRQREYEPAAAPRRVAD
ncbi:MAG TPA: hypothetical protein VE650_03250 [Acetobacteraceae bacterium]|nr:hypothetical protein [Acetobacteraceae bacterium]